LLTLSGSNSYTGNTTVSAGNLKFNSTSAIPTTGTTTISSGGAVLVAGAYTSVTDWLNTSRGRIDPSSAGALALVGNYTSGITMTNYNSLSIGSTGNYTLSGTITPANNVYKLGGGGGTLTVSSNLVNQSSPTVARSLEVNGNVTLTGANNTFSGVTTVYSGALTIGTAGYLSSSTNSITLCSGSSLFQNNNGSTKALSRPINFNTDSTFGGSGRYSGNLTVNGGHLSPGATGVGSIGTLTIGGTGNVTLSSTSVLDFDFGTTAGSCDLLAMTGTSRTLILNGTLNITNSGGVARGDYTIISGFSSYSGSLSFGSLPMGHDWSMAITDVGSYHNLVITAAPEPGTIVLLTMALLSLASYTWRKRRNGK
jgi:autotransporter-associated beta strand protein